MMRPVVAALIAVMFASSAIAPAHAAGQPKAAASANGGKTEFAAGRSRFAAKDYAGALIFFRKAFEASGSPNASLYVGLCLIELNQPVEAYEVLAGTARESEKRMAADPAYQHTNEVAKEKLGELEKKVARVTVTVDATGGAAVTVNGAAVAPDRLGSSVAVAPGKVVVAATTPGQPEQRAEVVVAAGEDKPVALHFAPAASAGAVGPAKTVDIARSSGGGGGLTTMRIAGIAVAGVGVVGFVIAGAASAASGAKYNDVKTHCGAPCTNPTFVDEINSGKTLDAVATTGLIVGIVGVAGGATLFILGGRKSDARTSLEIGPRAIRVSGSF
jgi:hypothetical protein